MVPCGLADHRHCTVSVSRHTLHLRVVTFFFLNVLLCLIGFYIFYIFILSLIMNIHIYNLFYICTGTHACMGFVPDNKLIRIRITYKAIPDVVSREMRTILMSKL